MTDPLQRVSFRIAGWVQGVGFRPYVYRLARDLGLTGWVGNTPEGVALEVEGPAGALTAFRDRLPRELPPRARIDGLHAETLEPAGYPDFRVRESATAGPLSALPLPDLAVCPACVAELFDPADRRYRYPFISCTDCGPRWSIVESLPFDRERTSMARFEPCPACGEEYGNPADRRFHAQTQCCPVCGPQLALLGTDGRVCAVRDQALREAVAALREGAILALKGIGGFQLLTDARDAAAVARLRQRKQRPAKPLAVMLADPARVRAHCRLTALEESLLSSPAAPIVLLRRNPGTRTALPPGLAPGNPYLGVMLPYSPLHHLLLAEFGGPLVCTSGNLSGEPICIDEAEALARLGGVADLFLVHDRPIRRPLDDSVVRTVGGRPLVLRRARGYAPVLSLARPLPEALAVGGHLKNTLALGSGRRAVLSQHLGDLDTAEARTLFERTAEDLQRLFGLAPERLISDLHPDYAGSSYAEASGKPVLRVQHHHAHVLSCMAEHGLEPPLLGLAFDGIGYGPDATLWGGEFLRIEPGGSYRRYAHLRGFPLPGGSKAVREPRRAALGLLYEALGAAALDCIELAPVAAFGPAERRTLGKMLERRLNAPRCTSAGRLFDAVAALLGLCQINGFEGEAAMALEFAAEEAETAGSYPYLLAEVGEAPGTVRRILDWGPMILPLLEDFRARGPAPAAAGFHRTLADMAAAVAVRAGLERVVLSGGAFQNRLLTELTVARLEAEGFRVFRHEQVPPNDGGLALGQLWAAGLAAPAGEPP